jgi:hypothetical protein
MLKLITISFLLLQGFRNLVGLIIINAYKVFKTLQEANLKLTAFLCACNPSASAIISMALPMF